MVLWLSKYSVLVESEIEKRNVHFRVDELKHRQNQKKKGLRVLRQFYGWKNYHAGIQALVLEFAAHMSTQEMLQNGIQASIFWGEGNFNVEAQN